MFPVTATCKTISIHFKLQKLRPYSADKRAESLIPHKRKLMTRIRVKGVIEVKTELK